MLGTMREALKAIELSGDMYGEGFNKLYKDSGWQFLNEGSTRVAFLSPSNIVYKVDHSDCHENYNEYRVYLWLKERFPKLINMVAECYLWELRVPVIAMEYVPGECNESDWNDCKVVDRLSKTFEGIVSDIIEENVRRRYTGEYIIVDYSRSSLVT